MALIYEVTSNHDYWLHSTKEWMRYEKENYVCKSKVLCNKLDRTIYPKSIDVVIKELPETRILYSRVFGSIAAIHHVDFINQIRTKMDGFVFGKCYLPDKTLVEEYVTCYSKDVIVIRGAYGSKYIQCVDCKSIVSAKEPIYVLERYLTGASVYQDAIQGLYIDGNLAMELDFSPWPDLELEPIPIRDKPVDKQKLICDPDNPDWEVEIK